jgi:hypothetical protein
VKYELAPENYDLEKASATGFHVVTQVAKLVADAVANGQGFTADFAIPQQESGQSNRDGSLEIRISIKGRGQGVSDQKNPLFSAGAYLSNA